MQDQIQDDRVIGPNATPVGFRDAFRTLAGLTLPCAPHLLEPSGVGP